MKITTRPSTLADADSLGPRLRQSDRDELVAGYGWNDPTQVLRGSVAVSQEAVTLELNGVPVIMAGIAPYPFVEGLGSPWLLASPEIEDVPVAFYRTSRRFIERWLETFPVMTQWVDARNDLSIQWMLWLGFTIDKVDPHHGKARIPFIKFTRS